MDGQNDLMNRKIVHIITITPLVFLIIILRLGYLQIIKGDALLRQSQKNYLRVEKIRSPRGNILDRNGKLLATNRPSTDLYWRGTGNARLSAAQHKTMQTISQILEKPLSDDGQTMRMILHTERYQKEYLLANDLSFDQLSKLLEQLPGNKNIRLSTQFKRHYPYKDIASHIIGYLGTINFDYLGKMGIEKIFEEDLRGQEGMIIKTINSFGTRLSEEEMQTVIIGKDIYTTIDINLQYLAESLFTQEQQGTLIVMDPQHGDILALVSRPNFSPDLFLQRIMAADWQTLQENHPFLNRACNACYPPGSIFKLITASAALEQGIITPDTTNYCKGYIKFGGRNYGCNNRYGHGNLSATQSIAKSCNILFFEIAKKLNIDTLADYAKRFGLGEKTGITLTEKPGIVPSTVWKHEIKHERWWPGETLSVAIGQSYLLVTPIQIARMISSIFSHYLVTPRITLTSPIHKEPINIKPETLDFLQQAMRAAVHPTGTGRRLAVIKDITIYSKTSTAQISALQKRRLANQFLEHGWVVAYVEYKEYRPFVLVVLVENAGSSSIPTIIAKQFISEYKNIANDPDYQPVVTYS